MEKEKQKAFQRDWYTKNRDKVIERTRLYDIKNAENLKERKKRYYEKNKAALIAAGSIKTRCETCNKDVSHINRHVLTKRHLKKKEKLENPEAPAEKE